MSNQPTPNQLAALRAVEKAQSGAQAVINTGYIEECCDFEWAEPIPSGGYRLTEQGRAVLQNSN